MDLVSLLASIDTLADRAFKLVSFINTIKEGGKQRLSLFTELNALWMVLKLLEGHFQSDDEELSDPWLETIAVLDEENGIFDQISTAFENLDNRLRPKSGHRKIMQTLRWPFDKSEVEHHVHQLQRLKSYVDSAMNSTSAADIRKIQRDTKAIKLSVADDELKAILQWISELNFLKQQNEITEQTREGAGQWFLERKTFLIWKSEVEAMLWLPGIPGAGKTFLASIVFEHLKKAHEGQNVAVLIIYCGYHDTKSQSVGNLVAALIKQILQLRADVSKELRELYRQSSRTEVFPSLAPLTKVLRSELAKFDNCYIIVDGLDEIPDEPNRLLLLETLIHGKVNIMVTSRRLESIQELFLSIKDISCDGCEKENMRLIFHCKQCLGRGFDLCDECHSHNMTCTHDDHYFVKNFGSYQIEVGADESDVRLYVEGRIGREPKLLENVTKRRTLREEIASTIVEQSNGMFLLARLHIDALATKRTPKAVQEALQSLPTKIGDTYDQAMQRIEQANEDDRQIAKKFLQWISFAIRPLTVPEVEHACAIDARARDIDSDEVLRASDMTSICAGLVIIDASEIVRLVHFSAQNYFQENRQRWFPEGDISLACDCLSYLSFKAFDSGPSTGPTERDDFETRSSEYPLLEYCSSYWGLHAASADQPQELTQRILAFLNNTEHFNSAIQALWYSDSPDVAGWDVKSGVHPLHLTAYFGLTRVTSRLLSAGAAADSRDSQGATPLMYAAAGGNAPVVQELLREGADPNLVCERGSSSLHRAIAFDKLNVARILLDHPNIDVNLVDRSRSDQTALMLASYFGRGQIVPIVVHKPGLDVNLQSGKSQSTALHCAAESGDAQIVRFILDHPDVDVNKRNDWCTPLTLAARNGYLSVVEALLDHGADTELQEGADRASGTPLNRAIDYGYIRIVRLLLERGANPTVVDIYKRTIVHSAAVNGQDEVLRVLFNFSTGVNINAQGTNGRTAMHDAAYFNYCSTIILLSEHGARTDIHDGAGRSPLGVAKDMNNLEALELLTRLRKEEEARDESIGLLKHTNTLINGNEIGLLKAAKLGMTETVRSYIARAPSDPSIELNISDLDQHTALHLAITYNHVDILGLLVGAGTDMNAIDRLKRTPLHYTALSGDYTAAECLLEAGARVDLEDHFGETALEIGLSNRYYEFVVLLLEHGAWPKTTSLQLSLYAAAMYGSAEMVKRLVDAGADPLKKETSGESPYHFAEYARNKETAEMILSLCERRGQPGQSSKAAN